MSKPCGILRGSIDVPVGVGFGDQLEAKDSLRRCVSVSEIRMNYAEPYILS